MSKGASYQFGKNEEKFLYIVTFRLLDIVTHCNGYKMRKGTRSSGRERNCGISYH